MKTILSIAMLGLVAPLLRAAPFAITVGNPAYDPFNYTAGAVLSAQVNPQGLAWAPTGNAPTHQPTVASGSLSWSGLATSSGNSAAFGSTVAASGDSTRLALGTFSGAGITSGTLYYSMILEVNNLSSLGTSGDIIAGFNSATGTSTSQPSVIDGRLYMVAPSAGSYQFGLEVSGVNPTYFATVYNTLPQTFLLVERYTFSSVSPNNDSVDLWINPVSSSFGTATPPPSSITVNASASDVGISRSTGIQSFVLHEAVASEPNMIADELRVGLTWADVTPPPSETVSFSGLSSNPTSDTYGSSVTLSGTVSANSPNALYPNIGETVTVTINGNAKAATINDATGDFSVAYNPGNHVPASATPYTVTYSYAGNGYLSAASDTSTTLTMNKANQTVTWVVSPLTNQVYGVAPFSILGYATNNSGALDSYSVVSGPATTTGANGTTLTITGVGTVTLDANQTGAANYNAATPVPQSFTVSNSFNPVTIASQTITATGLQVCWPTVSGVVYNVLTNGNLNQQLPANWVELTGGLSPITGDGGTDCVTIPSAVLPSTNLFVLIKQNSN